MSTSAATSAWVRSPRRATRTTPRSYSSGNFGTETSSLRGCAPQNGSRPNPQQTPPTCPRGDKARSSRPHRSLLRPRGISAVTPERADQAGHRKSRGSRGGRPVGYDVQDYRQRNVERILQPHEELARLTSRYDKHAVGYRGGVVLAAILDRLR